MPLFGPPDIEKLKAKRDVKGLIKALGHRKDAEVREGAVKALGEIGDTQAVGPLSAALKDESWYVRLAAARALGQIGDVRAVEPLIAALKDKDKNVRQATAEALGRIGDTRAVEPLITTLEDEDEDVGEAAAKALVKVGAPAIEPLTIALKNEAWDVRQAAAEALERLGWQPDSSEIGIAYWIARKQLDKCAEIGAPAVEPLIATLEDEAWHVRQAAAEALGKIGDVQAVESLITALKDENYRVRAQAALSLGQIGDTRAVRPLAALLRDDEDWLLERTAEALGYIGPEAEKAVPDLIQALEYGKKRSYIIRALAKIGDPRATESFIDIALKSKDSSEYKAAIEALGDFGDARAVKDLILLLEDEETLKNLYARSALVKIGAPAVEPLIATLENPNVHAVDALDEIADVRAVEPLISLLKDRGYLKASDSSKVCSSAIRALGNIGTPEAVAHLVTLLQDEDDWVRKMAKGILTAFAGEDLGDDASCWQQWWDEQDQTQWQTSGRLIQQQELADLKAKLSEIKVGMPAGEVEQILGFPVFEHGEHWVYRHSSWFREYPLEFQIVIKYGKVADTVGVNSILEM
jgi:HEAT repeat protein